MNETEARELLGLHKTGALKRAKVDATFNALFRTHQAFRDSACTRDERENETRILILLKEAHDICLKLCASTAGTQVSSPIPAGQGNPAAPLTPRPVYQPPNQTFTGNGAFTGITSRFRDVFVHLWLAVKNLFGFLVEIPDAFQEFKDLVSDTMFTLRQAGIPRFAVVLALILFLVPIFNGCSRVVHSLFGWFR